MVQPTKAITRNEPAMEKEKIEEMRETIARLKAFKEYVHKRLDDMGIPVNPESSHKIHGCRIGGRLDIVEQLSRNEAITSELMVEKNFFAKETARLIDDKRILQELNERQEAITSELVSAERKKVIEELEIKLKDYGFHEGDYNGGILFEIVRSMKTK
jgi:hypothetical protein